MSEKEEQAYKEGAVMKIRDEEEVGSEGSGVQDDKEETCKCTRQSMGVWPQSV